MRFRCITGMGLADFRHWGVMALAVIGRCRFLDSGGGVFWRAAVAFTAGENFGGFGRNFWRIVWRWIGWWIDARCSPADCPDVLFFGGGSGGVYCWSFLAESGLALA